MLAPRDHAPAAAPGDFHLLLAEPGSNLATPEALVRRQAALLALGRRASAQPPANVLIQDALALAVDVLDADLGGMGELSPDRESLVLKVAATDKRGKLVHPVAHPITLEPTASMAGFALQAACPVVSADLSSEGRFRDVVLRRLGVAGAVCVPLCFGHALFGVLGVYTRTVRQFTPDDVHFVETIAHMLTSPIARAGLETELAQQQALTSALLDSVQSFVLTLDQEGNLLSMNRACEQVSGYRLAEVRGKPPWQVFVTPEEVDLVRRIVRTATSAMRPCEFEALLMTKGGARRPTVWAIRPFGVDQAKSQTLLMVGTDRTEQARIEERLLKAEQRAEQAIKALADLRGYIDRQGQAPGSSAAPGLSQPTASSSSGAAAPGKEQRTSPRRAFHYYQLIAPMFDQRIPRRPEFFPVECRDISAGGIAFLFDRRPDFETLVVILGRPPAENYFTARVVRVAEDRHDGKLKYVIGCQFTGRVALE